MRNALSLLLVSILGLSGVLAACGGPPPESQVPTNPTASTSSTPVATASETPSATPSTAPSASVAPIPSASATPPPAIAMKDPMASAMAADLQKIGLDLKKLPPMATLAKTEKKKLRAVMDYFVKATGFACKDCHDPDDFAKATPLKNETTHMWDEWARGMTLADGSPIFCDSCHQGQKKILDRSDKKALGKWMQAAFVDKLSRKDKKENNCATCHGTEMDMDFLDQWKKK
jgi:nitrate reductase cytochrome c-type subunit